MTSTSRFSPARGLLAMSRRMSLKAKLPLLMSLVLATVLGVALLATYGSLRRTQIAAVSERLVRATKQLAALGAAGTAIQHARFLPVANDSAVRRALVAPTSRARTVALHAALGKLSLPTDSGLPIELWTADGRRVGFIGDDVRATMRVAPGHPELPDRIASVADEEGAMGPDSLRLGPLYADNGRVSFWYVMPIRDRGPTLGYLTQQRRLAVGPNANRTLRELSGDSVSLVYRNLDGGFWASVTGVASAGPTNIDTVRGMARDSTGEAVLYHEERIGSTPLVAAMTVPARHVLSRPRRFFEPILWLTLVLMALGVFAAWTIGRRVAIPITQITLAADALARGDYEARVPAKGEREVRQLAETFNRMAAEISASRRALEEQTAQAKAASSAKSEFLTMMSHELRTPLNAIGGYVDLLEMELRGPVTQTQRRDLDRIKQSQQYLLGLISGVLDLARVEAGKISYDLEGVAVDPFLAGLDSLIAPQATAKSVSLEHVPADPSLAVMADREKLRQVLLNLLSNAIRHTPAGGHVRLSAAPSTGNVLIAVEDTGPGIPPDKIEAIFEPFVQLDRSLTQNRDGLGLGLSISRDLARGMSGDLTVESRVGAGARFVLTLPLCSLDPSRIEPRTGESRVVTKA